MLPRRGLRFDDLLRRQVRAAEEAHLSLPHQLVERAQGFLDRSLRVRAMQLVKIDPIGTQPLQARLDRLHDIAPRRPLELAGVIHRQAELARQHDRFALLAENSSEPLLRAAFVAVAVGGVDQVDAELDRPAYDAARRRKIDAAAKIVAAEADDGHLERGAAKPPLVHPDRLAHCARVSPRIFRASSGVPISRPSPRAMPAMRSTSTALFLANSPGAM